MNRFLVPVAVAGLALAWAALAETAPAPAAQPDLAKGKQVAAMCAACHGPDGNSVVTVNPSLAGQQGQYITKQLANFKSGERKNPTMMGMSAALSPEDMKSVGAWFEQQQPKPDAAKDATLAAAGEKIYRGGIAASGVPACAACHSPTGAGIPAQYPRLAGQHADYTLTQLKAFRAGERGNDNAAMMRTIAAKLSDRDMQALAEFVAGLRP